MNTSAWVKRLVWAGLFAMFIMVIYQAVILIPLIYNEAQIFVRSVRIAYGMDSA